MAKVMMVWKCDLCPKTVTVKSAVRDGEIDDSNHLPPRGMHWCQDHSIDHIFCGRHKRAWDAKVRRENPDAVWVA